MLDVGNGVEVILDPADISAESVRVVAFEAGGVAPPGIVAGPGVDVTLEGGIGVVELRFLGGPEATVFHEATEGLWIPEPSTYEDGVHVVRTRTFSRFFAGVMDFARVVSDTARGPQGDGPLGINVFDLFGRAVEGVAGAVQRAVENPAPRPEEFLSGEVAASGYPEQTGSCELFAVSGWKGPPTDWEDDLYEARDGREGTLANLRTLASKAQGEGAAFESVRLFRWYEAHTTAAEAIRAAREGHRIVLVGHSAGGAAVHYVAHTLGVLGYPVEVLVDIDTYTGRSLNGAATRGLQGLLYYDGGIPINVRVAVNRYQDQSWYYKGRARPEARSDLLMPFGHTEIDAQVAAGNDIDERGYRALDAIVDACGDTSIDAIAVVAHVVEEGDDFTRRFEYAVFASPSGDELARIRASEFQRDSYHSVNARYLAIRYETSLAIHTLDGTLVRTIPLAGPGYLPVLAPGRRPLVAVDTAHMEFDPSNAVRVFDVRTGEEVWSRSLAELRALSTVPERLAGPVALAWTPDARSLIGSFALGSEFEPEVWVADLSGMIRVIAPAGGRRSLEPEGRYIAYSALGCGHFGEFARRVDFVAPATGQTVATFALEGEALDLDAWSLDGNQVVGEVVPLGAGGRCPPFDPLSPFETTSVLIKVATGERLDVGARDPSDVISAGRGASLECDRHPEASGSRCTVDLWGRNVLTDVVEPNVHVRETNPRPGAGGSSTGPPAAPRPTEPSDEIVLNAQVEVAGARNCLNLRDAPTTTAQVLDCLPNGVRTRIVGGPVEADGYRWWRLSSGGWAVEGFLRPTGG